MKSNIKSPTEQEVVADGQGEQDLCHDLAIKPLTRRLIDRLSLDQPLEPILIVDFGVESAAHYRALKAALFDNATDDVDDEEDAGRLDTQRQRAFHERIVELDAAYGEAAKLNTFIQRHAPTYGASVHFNPTSWDRIYGRA